MTLQSGLQLRLRMDLRSRCWRCCFLLVWRERLSGEHAYSGAEHGTRCGLARLLAITLPQGLLCARLLLLFAIGSYVFGYLAERQMA